MTCCGITTRSGSPGSSSGGGAPVPEQGAIIQEIDPAGASGSTDDLVALFQVATVQIGAVALASWLSRSDTVALGTVVTIIQEGVYTMHFYVPWATGQNVGCALTIDATVAQRQTVVPEPTAPEVLATNFRSNTSIQATPVWATVNITPAIIAAGENTLRAHTFNPLAAGSPAAGAAYVNGPACAWQIRRIGSTGL